MNAINPQHYQLDNGSQVIDITENMNFNLGNVIKYAARAGRKPGNDALTDLDKAVWYLNRERERIVKAELAGLSERITERDKPKCVVPELTTHPTITSRAWRDNTGHILKWQPSRGWMRHTHAKGWMLWSDIGAKVFGPFTAVNADDIPQ